MEKQIKREPFKSLEIDCDRRYMAINGKEIFIDNVTEVNVNVHGGHISLEVTTHDWGEFGHDGTETSQI